MEKVEAGIPDFIQKYIIDLLKQMVGTIDWAKALEVVKKALVIGLNSFIDSLEGSLRNHEIEIGGALHETIEALLIGLLEKCRILVVTTFPVPV